MHPTRTYVRTHACIHILICSYILPSFLPSSGQWHASKRHLKHSRKGPTKIQSQWRDCLMRAYPSPPLHPLKHPKFAFHSQCITSRHLGTSIDKWTSPPAPTTTPTYLPSIHPSTHPHCRRIPRLSAEIQKEGSGVPQTARERTEETLLI